MTAKVRKFIPWPRTMSMQLIVVTALAVLFSNVAVAIWYEYVNEQQNQAFFTDRLLERTAQYAGSLSAISPGLRADVLARNNNPRSLFRFAVRDGKVPAIAMNDEERSLAARVKENLPPELTKYPVTAHRAVLDMRNEPRSNGGSALNRGGPNNRGNGDGPPGAVSNRSPNASGTDNRGDGINRGPQGAVIDRPPNASGDGRNGGPPGNRDRGPQMAAVLDLAVQIDDQTYLTGRSIRPEDDSGPQWPTRNILAMVLTIAMTSAGAALLARRMSKPLAKLTDAASEVAKGGAAPRVPEEGPDDVKRAATAFNAMTDQVQRTLASQRQLLTAVGHDLRTPITAMRLSMEFLEDGETRESLEKNLNELQQLTEAVLSAAKGAGGETKRNVDVATLLDSLCADLEEIGEPVTWESHGPATLFCRTNEITRAARNLIENAVAYGKVARVRLEDSKDNYDIVVEDDGPGIPEADRERVFEPFVRLETSRNLATGGTGLGLTLVKAIAEGHGGSVILENRPQGGLTVRLRLPRTDGKA